MNANRLLVILNHALYRQGVVRLLQDQGPWDLVGDSDLSPQALDKVESLKPNLVLLDLGEAGSQALAILHQIRVLQPAVDVVVLALSDEDDRVLEALRLGAKGCVTKTADSRVLIKSLTAVLAGEAAVSRSLTRRLLGAVSERRWEVDRSPSNLTISGREKEVLSLLASGATNAEIAVDLCIAPNTVRSHVRTILQKLELHNRVQAAAYAVREGLAQPNGHERRNGHDGPNGYESPNGHR